MRRLKQNVFRKTLGRAGRIPQAKLSFGAATQFGGRAWSVLSLVILLVSTANAFKGEGEVKGRRSEPERQQSAIFPKLTVEQSKAAQVAADAGVRVTWHSKTDTPSSVRGVDLGGRKEFSGRKGLRAKGGGASRENAVVALDKMAPLFRIKDAENEFDADSVVPDSEGFRHVRMKQAYQRLPVVGGELIVHFNQNDQVYEVNGQYVPDIAVGTVPSLKAQEAEQAARTDLSGKGVMLGRVAGKPSLVIFARSGDPRLAFELTLTSDDGKGSLGLWRYWIDALTGTVLSSYNDVKRISGPTSAGVSATITGNILDGEGGTSVNVQGWYENTGFYYLSNNTDHWLVYNIADSGYIDESTYAYRASSNWGMSDQAEMSSARGFDIIQKYYKQVHNRNSYDNKGVLARVNVHQGIDYVNAFWDPDSMQFYIGDGDGMEANSLAVLDVLGHEFTHAVTERTANLTYANESGALNESFSDIFGACIEFYGQPDDRASYPGCSPGKADWLCGEDCWLSSTALRDLRNPANTETVGAGNEQPTFYQGTYWYSGLLDNGGVHQNSGVQNFFFYLLCEGGSGTNENQVYNVPGIGITNAQRVAYRTLSVYCTANTDYEAARTAWISAAQDLNTNWVRSVKKAWNAVLGVTKPVLFSPDTLPTGRVGTYYNYTLGLAGGVSPYTWTMTDGTLPANLSFDNGVISGFPEVATTVAFTVSVKDDENQVVTKSYTLTIVPPFGIPFHETFESGGAMPDGWWQEYGQGKIDWSFRTGSPQGHPAAAYSNDYNAFFGVEVTNQYVTRLVSPRIEFGPNAQAAALSFWQYMDAWLGENDELRVYYKTTATGEWSQVASFVSAVDRWTKRTVSLPGPYSSYYVAFEGTTKYGYGICLDEVRIFDPTPPLGITTESPLISATTEVPYSFALSAEGGVAPYSFDIVSGALPDGFSLSTNGVISGLSSNVQSSTFTVRLTDNVGGIALKTFSFEVLLPRADLFAESFENMGYIPDGWTQEFVTNSVSWDFRVGAPFGHPSAPASGQYNACFFSSAWANGNTFDQKTKLITPPINLGQAPRSIRLTFWHHMQEWEGGQDELRLFYRTSTNSAWVPLTDGVYLTTVNSWTQRAVMLPSPSTTYQIAFEGNAHFGYGVCLDDIRVTDATDAPLFTTDAALPDGVVDVPYGVALAVSGGLAPYTWSLVSGSLPSGLSLDGASGVVSGTPASSGLRSFQVKVAGSDGKATTNLFSLRITAARPMPFTETFENGGLIPGGWSQEYVLRGQSWIFRSGSPVSPGGVPAAAHGGQYNACLYYDAGYACGTRLVSPMLNVGSGTNAQAQLTFWHCMANYLGDQDELRVLYRTSVTSSWQVLASYTQDVPGWTERTLDLPNPSTTYFIAFEGWAKYGYGVCVDDITVTGNSTLSPYETWKVDVFGEDAGNEAVAGDTADPDGDGIPNALEYAMGLDPTVPDTTGLPTGGVTAGYLTLSFRMDKGALDAGVLYEVEACTNLIEAAWTTAGVSEQLPRADSNAWWQAVFQHDVPVTNAPRRFLRLKVTLP